MPGLGTFQVHFRNKSCQAAGSLILPGPATCSPAAPRVLLQRPIKALAEPRHPAVGTGENSHHGAFGHEPKLQRTSCRVVETSRTTLVDLLTGHL